jgi:hypothetical protein
MLTLWRDALRKRQSKMEIQYINGRRVVIGAPFLTADQRTIELAKALAEVKSTTVRATLPNGMKFTTKGGK